MKVPKQKCVGGPHNLSDEQLSKWKRQLLENAATLFEPADKQSDASAERITQLEQLVGRLTLALEIEKKSLDLETGLNRSEKREMVEALRTDYSVRQICDTLGLNRSSLYYQPKRDPSEEVLRDEIEKLSARYPKYGNHRRITQLLLRMGYTIVIRRVARLMKEDNLWFSVNVPVKPLNRLTV